MTPSFKHRVQYGVLRTLLAVLSFLPWRAAGALGAAIGRLGYWPLRIRRSVVERQLAASFPGRDARELNRIAVEAYANLGRIAFETALLAKLPRGAVLELFHPPLGWEHLEAAMAGGQGVILISGHMANWELGVAYLAQRGLPVDAIVRRMTNPLFDSYLTRSRKRLGVTVVPDQEAVRRTPRSIREGRIVCLLADQGGKGLSSTYVPFFGRPARTPRGPAVFALRLGAPCVCAVITREADGRYRFNIEPFTVTETGDRDRDVDAIVAAYAKNLEEWVRRYPGQYLWQHRRWRRQADGTLDDG